ncbi:MAG: hypothetical protein H5T34_07855 [Candidatus Methanomethyliales bacterium]|nr:hypothetical protein [Candidatus Methanomethylicales archaeon]
MPKFLLLYLIAISLSQSEALIFLDDAPVNNATVMFGDQVFTVNGGHFNIPGAYDWLKVTIEGQCFNLSIPKERPINLWHFYHCDIVVLDSGGKYVNNFTLYLNDISLGQISRVIVPSGESLLKIVTRNSEYSFRINVSSSSRISITLPASDLEILLTSKDGFPVKNQTLLIKFENSSEYLMKTDDNGFVRLDSAPHGLYTISVLRQERTFIHNSSVRHRFTIDLIENVSVVVERAYLLFPTKVLVKFSSTNGRPSINSPVTLEYEGTEYIGLTDSDGQVSFYIPPSLSTYGNISVMTGGVRYNAEIHRSPLPLMLVILMMSALIFSVSKRSELPTA